MTAIAFLVVVVLGIATFLFSRKHRQSERRREILETPFPVDWQTILERNVGLYRQLPAAIRKDLHRRMQMFLAEKMFEGCNGLEINDEIRVTIAGQSCLLLLHHPTKCYPGLHTILVYPGAYRPRRLIGVGLRHEPMDVVLAGQSNPGTVVLSWDETLRGSMDPADARNVVLHEFAHQLDQEDGTADGAPILERASSYVPWARILGREYAALQAAVAHDRQALLEAYGATNPAEFFAVATETFFEQPQAMRQEHPELYRELQSFYKLDPAAWMEGEQVRR